MCLFSIGIYSHYYDFHELTTGQENRHDFCVWLYRVKNKKKGRKNVPYFEGSYIGRRDECGNEQSYTCCSDKVEKETRLPFSFFLFFPIVCCNRHRDRFFFFFWLKDRYCVPVLSDGCPFEISEGKALTMTGTMTPYTVSMGLLSIYLSIYRQGHRYHHQLLSVCIYVSPVELLRS